MLTTKDTKSTKFGVLITRTLRVGARPERSRRVIFVVSKINMTISNRKPKILLFQSIQLGSVVVSHFAFDPFGNIAEFLIEEAHRLGPGAIRMRIV